MTDIELQHDTEGTLLFRRAQEDERDLQSSPDVVNAPADDRDPLVQVFQRQDSYRIRGQVTASKLSQDAEFADDWEQALAEYITKLESFCYIGQGGGYTLHDAIRNTNVPVVCTAVEWERNPGAAYEISYTADLQVGNGVLGSESRDVRTANVQAFNVPARIDGNDLPGLRGLTVLREWETEVYPLAFTQDATENDIVADTGVQHSITFEGEITGDKVTRNSFDSTIEALEGVENVAFETRFPGYSLTGVLTRYNSDRVAQSGVRKHSYEIEFLEGRAP